MNSRYRSSGNVDETLFGNGPNGTGTLKNKRSQTCLPAISSTILTAYELEKIKVFS